MTFEQGLLMFFTGTSITIGGFFIAFLVARHYYDKENAEKNREKWPWEN
jgi:hypothetical protein|tara:strand:+ start:917 stop:1063 length:147 start_codon:yes stop_codon:yes gene_type:complete